MAFNPQPTLLPAWTDYVGSYAPVQHVCYYNDYIYMLACTPTGGSALYRMHRVTHAQERVVIDATRLWRNSSIVAANGKIYCMGHHRTGTPAGQRYITWAEVDCTTFLNTWGTGYGEYVFGQTTGGGTLRTDGTYVWATFSSGYIYRLTLSSKAMIQWAITKHADVWEYAGGTDAYWIGTDCVKVNSNTGAVVQDGTGVAGTYQCVNCKDHIVTGSSAWNVIYVFSKATCAVVKTFTSADGLAGGAYGYSGGITSDGGRYAYICGSLTDNPIARIDTTNLTIELAGSFQGLKKYGCGRGTTAWVVTNTTDRLMEFTTEFQIDHPNDYSFDGTPDFNAYSDSYTPPWVGTPMRHPVLQDFQWQPPVTGITNTPPA